MIIRQNYLDQLIAYKDRPVIKSLPVCGAAASPRSWLYIKIIC